MTSARKHRPKEIHILACRECLKEDITGHLEYSSGGKAKEKVFASLASAPRYLTNLTWFQFIGAVDELIGEGDLEYSGGGILMVMAPRVAVTADDIAF
jgi:hypothetical protein